MPKFVSLATNWINTHRILLRKLIYSFNRYLLFSAWLPLCCVLSIQRRWLFGSPIRYFLMLFSPHGMLFFPSPGKSSIFQIQVDDPRHSLPNPQMPSTNFGFAVSSIVHHILLCLFLKYTDFNWAGCSLKGDTVSTFVDWVFSQHVAEFLSHIKHSANWMNKWMTCRSIVNMVCGSYHLGCRRWEVLLSPLFRRGKLDSGCFPGSPWCDTANSQSWSQSAGQRDIQAGTSHSHERGFICFLQEVIFLWDFYPHLCILHAPCMDL